MLTLRNFLAAAIFFPFPTPWDVGLTDRNDIHTLLFINRVVKPGLASSWASIYLSCC